MALFTDTGTIVALSKDTPNLASADPNVAPPKPSFVPAGWMKLQMGSDGAEIWRPVADATAFGQLTIGMSYPLSWG